MSFSHSNCKSPIRIFTDWNKALKELKSLRAYLRKSQYTFVNGFFISNKILSAATWWSSADASTTNCLRALQRSRSPKCACEQCWTDTERPNILTEVTLSLPRSAMQLSPQVGFQRLCSAHEKDPILSLLCHVMLMFCWGSTSADHILRRQIAQFKIAIHSE